MATRVFEKPVSRDMLDLQRSIAITANGNTHAAISTGQFVYVKNHSTLTDGLYVATDDIVEDGTLSSSNLTADTSGGLNALQAQIDDITGDIGTVPSGKTLQGQINANSAHIDNLQDGLAIVSDNNTHAAIASGQFVYVKNHGTLDEGMYKATAAIAQNETLSSSNLTAVADGGLNAVKSDIPAVVNDLTSDSTTSALSAAQGKALNGNIAKQNIMMDAVSGSNEDTFIANALSAINTRFSFPGLSTGSVLQGNVTWSGHDYYAFTVTKTSNDYVEAEFMCRAKKILCRYTYADGTCVIRNILLKTDIVTEEKYINNSESVSANSVKYFDIPISKTGYKASGILTITGSSTSGLVLQEFYITSNSTIARIYFRNATNSAITPTKITVLILYINQ